MDKHEKIQEWTRTRDIAANEIAKMAVNIENVTFAGALDILEKAKRQIEREMQRQRAKAPAEPVNEWGHPLKQETPDAATSDVSGND